jgi:hypothetical protein
MKEVEEKGIDKEEGEKDERPTSTYTSLSAQTE